MKAQTYHLYLASYLFLSALSISVSAQIKPLSGKQEPQANNAAPFNIHWEKPITQTAPETGEITGYLHFKGAMYNSKKHHIPEFFQHTSIEKDINHLKITLVNPLYVALTPEESKVLGANSKYVKNEITPEYNIIPNSQFTIHNSQFADIYIMPLVKNAATGKIEKLVSFSLQIEQSYVPEKSPLHHAPGSFAANSVLNSGSWFKIGVTKDGIYKLTYSFLKRAGVNMATLVPANIRIYGNGGGMLPQNNSAPRLDDLAENAIYVNGNSDSVFKTKDYVLFYGQGPVVWTYNASSSRYSHQVNLYSDTTYYFVNINTGPGKRIGIDPSSSATPSNTVTSFDDYAYHEVDGTNLMQSGSLWLGESFDITTQYSFSFSFPNIVASVPVYVNAAIASEYINADSSYYSVGSATIAVPPITGVYTDPVAYENSGSYTFTPTSSLVSVTVTKITTGAVGWLSYLELNARRQLSMSGDLMEFRDSKSFGKGNNSLFTVSSFSKIHVWDVTNPQNADSVALTSTAGGYSFELPNDSLKQFIAFTGNSFDSATFSGGVPNQNLHGMPQADLVIVANPLFLPQAQQLASQHQTHDGLKVNLVTTRQVYNEFSSGRQDPIAIRDFMRMFYNRAAGNYAGSPKYLLLFGGGSYDPKNRLQGNTNYVIAYESADSFDPANSYTSDDFYTLLDSNVTGPPDGGNYTLELGVGRLPADNTGEAQTMVNKIISYETPSGQPLNAAPNCCIGQSQYNMGNWKNTVCFIAHDGDDGPENDGDAFENEMETLSNNVKRSYPHLNINKIYLDAYQMVQTPGGPRYPSVNIAIDNQMDQGVLIMNYDGHGGPQGLAWERVLDFPDIYSWTNVNTLPLFFNASCDFSYWDNPLEICGGQLSMELPTGGVIAMIGAAREVDEGANSNLNDTWWTYLYTPLPDGSLPRFGDILKEAKNAARNGVNNLNFCLLGDPAVRLAYPENRVYTTSINSVPVTKTSPAVTLNALSKVTVTGYVGDVAGNILSNYNGLLYPTVYDKPDSITTLDNLGLTSPKITFALQNSTLYKGLVSVNNGKFSYTFVVPKDILYYNGFGKISYYSQNGVTDATGNDDSIQISGKATHVYNSGKGPQVRLYVNDSNFVYGGLTNQNPQLFAIVFDSNGVNTASNSIGHGITAVLDNNTANTYDLTSYYQPSLNSYQRGTITYPFTNLSSGTHTLSLRVWNVYDNTSASSTEFNVEQQAKLQLQHVLNYPNPFTTHTEFFFEINQVCDLMDVQIQIFSVSGRLVKNILTQVRTDSFRSEPIEWDGRDEYGDKIARGVYIYHVKVRTDQGVTADTYQKLVIL